MVGILVCGSNHFIVRGPRPDRETALGLARYWSVIEIGRVEKTEYAAWRISTKEFREDLEWAVIVPGDGDTSPAVVELLTELAARGVEAEAFG
jgi:hypothetical protein